jgi:hypothetical protein
MTFDTPTVLAIIGGAATLGGGLATGLWHAAMHVGRLTNTQELHDGRLDEHDRRLDRHDERIAEQEDRMGHFVGGVPR